jgi:signal transduction histidine kinase
VTQRAPARPRRFVPATLRARVTAVAALAVFAVLSAAGVGLVVAQRTALIDTVDEHLDQQADVVERELEAGRPVRAGDLPSEDVLVEIVAPDGGRIAASEGLDDPLPRGQAPDVITTVDLPDGEAARLLERDVDGTTVLLAGSLDDLSDSTAALAGSLLVAAPLISAVLAVVVWWAVGLALRPVEDIRARVDSISASRLDRRVPEPDAPREIARLARTMNAMLGRLQTSSDQQRRFVADASHELRSPLARMRAELEVDAAHPESADPAATSASVLAETVGVQRLVEDLLLLARGDAGALAVSPERQVDLDDVVETVVGSRRPAAGGRRVDTAGVRPVQASGDRAQLERLVGNLLDNAVRHARDTVTIALTEETGDGSDATAVLVVADDGPGIAPEDRERVFERFTRLDDARSAADGGAGLGLAIARDIAERHGGRLRLDGDRSGGARFVLTLPVARAGDG